MTDPRPGMPGVPPSLVNRAKNMIVTPQTEWNAVDAEPATVQGIYTSYVMILAAIPAVATAVGLILFPPRYAAAVEALGRSLGVNTSLSTGSIITGAVVQYALSLASVYVMALIINALAPNFGSQQDQLKAFKVAAYYPTAAWVFGILAVIPSLAALAGLAGLYSLYVLYIGLPRLMRTPADKQVGYFVVTLVLAIIVFVAVGYIAQRVVYGALF